jgi:hypothetical protein
MGLLHWATGAPVHCRMAAPSSKMPHHNSAVSSASVPSRLHLGVPWSQPVEYGERKGQGGMIVPPWSPKPQPNQRLKLSPPGLEQFLLCSYPTSCSTVSVGSPPSAGGAA